MALDGWMSAFADMMSWCISSSMITKRKPATVGETLVEEFMHPMGLTKKEMAEAMGVQRKRVNELCNDRRNVTAARALILARVFGNSPAFSPRERERIERATWLHAA